MKIIATIAAVLLLAAGAGVAAGQEWEISTDVTTDFRSIAGLSGAETGEAWAALATSAGKGKIFLYNGSDWTLDTTLYPGSSGEVRDLYMDESGDWGYIVGNTTSADGHIWRYNGVSYNLQTTVNAVGLIYFFSVYSPDSYHTWVCGNVGNVYYTENQGTTWTVQTNFGAGLFVQALSGNNTNDVWAVAGPTGGYDSNSIYHYNGTEWEVQTTINFRLYTISTTGGGGAWAGGYAGVILRYDGSEWSVFTDVGNPTVNSVAAGDNNKAWAGLSSGAILYFNGSAWSVETETSSTQGINKVAAAAGEVWAGGMLTGRSIGGRRGPGSTTTTATEPATSLSFVRVPASGRSGG